MAHVFAARLLPGWIERGEGHLITTASMAGILTTLAGRWVYAATKHAAVGFAEWLAITYAGRRCQGLVHLPRRGGHGDVAGRLVGDTSKAPAVIGGGGVLAPDEAATRVVAAVTADTFLILTHPEMQTYVVGKAQDTQRWIKGISACGPEPRSCSGPDVLCTPSRLGASSGRRVEACRGGGALRPPIRLRRRPAGAVGRPGLVRDSGGGGRGCGAFRAQTFSPGARWDCVVQPPLPYPVRFRLELGEVVAPEYVTASIEGDIDGEARLDVAAAGSGSELRLVSRLRRGTPCCGRWRGWRRRWRGSGTSGCWTRVCGSSGPTPSDVHGRPPAPRPPPPRLPGRRPPPPPRPLPGPQPSGRGLGAWARLHAQAVRERATHGPGRTRRERAPVWQGERPVRPSTWNHEPAETR